MTALAALFGARTLVACSGSSDVEPLDSSRPSNGRDGAASSNEPGSSNAPGDFGTSSDASTKSDCAEATKLVYTLDQQDGSNAVSLRRFAPATSTFSLVGELDCRENVGPYSMAVARDGTAWVLYTNGRLYKVSTEDASCTPTTFKSEDGSFETFGMGFASDGVGSSKETLYIASRSGRTNKFGSIDLGTLKVNAKGGLELNARTEFTGTGEGRLFGGFEGNPFVVAEVDPSTGGLLSQAPQNNIRGVSNFALAAWGGDFYLFFGFDVFRYRPGEATSTKVATVDFRVVGAGVSTCAPFTAPK